MGGNVFVLVCFPPFIFVFLLLDSPLFRFHIRVSELSLMELHMLVPNTGCV